MPNSFSFSLGGDKALNAAFKNLIKNVDDAELSTAGAEVVFELSQKDVPVDTGELKDSGKVIQKDDGAEVIYTAEHAAPVEFGTSKMAAQPYLRPAIDNHSKIQAEMERKLKRQIGA